MITASFVWRSWSDYRSHVIAFMALLSSSVCVVVSPHVQAYSSGSSIAQAALISEHSAIAPGQPFLVALKLNLPENWHTYWRNPGDSGAPARITWSLPEGFTAGPILWPTPERIVVEGPIVSYGHHGEVLLVAEMRPPDDLSVGAEVAIAADAEWLVCADICVPENDSLTLSLPVAAAGPAPEPSHWQGTFLQAMARVPKPAPFSTSFQAGEDNLVLSLNISELGTEGISEPWFFPATAGVIDHTATQSASLSDGVLTISVPGDPNAGPHEDTLAGVVVLRNERAPSAFAIEAKRVNTGRSQ